ncbi:lipopolysaccharide kinase InaA family protein [Pseudomonas sp. MAG002Y]|uniref:lipopolysaccharide kinase InaA family protein n=1 Tax=Pseudomonas sp. MAG002Y TaxID=2678690 RepID=UPI001C60A001|nr:lipopolysaccharide kinase InaA family protein [Pseudomonas sp. MAG002Y]MBW5414272.1 phosphotransferase [Pseudomonas sp. MAG002Y]
MSDMSFPLGTTSSKGTERSFENWWGMSGEWVEAPNERRGGESGVQRIQINDGTIAYVKRQVGHIYRSLRHPFGRPTALRERDALTSIAALGVGVPELLFCEARRDEQGWRALLVSAELDGYVSLEDWYASGAQTRYDQATRNIFLKQLGAMLARLHKARWQHGCLYDKHVFLRVRETQGEVDFDVALLDLEKCRRRFSARRAARRDLLQLKRHSSLSHADWQTLVYGYQAVFGRVIKGLQP